MSRAVEGRLEGGDDLTLEIDVTQGIVRILALDERAQVERVLQPDTRGLAGGTRGQTGYGLGETGSDEGLKSVGGWSPGVQRRRVAGEGVEARGVDGGRHVT